MPAVAGEANVGLERFEMVRRRPREIVSEIIAGLSGYREHSGKGFVGREAAPLVFPVVLNLGHPFRISFSPGDAPRKPSNFVAGLHPGAVEIASDGYAECVQIDLTLLGACRLLGGVIKGLTSDVVELGDALGPCWLDLRDRLADLRNWDDRFMLAETFIMQRIGEPPARDVSYAVRSILVAKGHVGIGVLAGQMGCSRKHLSARVGDTLGVGPKTLARMVRFNHACRLARLGARTWAEIAYAAGFADQAHLAREFSNLGGETPTAWANRLNRIDPELLRPW
jgi:AraC-like DNA-binding protein